MAAVFSKKVAPGNGVFFLGGSKNLTSPVELFSRKWMPNSAQCPVNVNVVWEE